MRASRVTFIILCLFILLTANEAYAAVQQKISVYLKPDITIKVGEQIKSFYDAKGELVFPIIYQGTTYLPVRAVSELMGENIEWEGRSNTVYIGRTLSNPSFSGGGSVTGAVRDGDIPAVLKPPVRQVDAVLNKDILVMYDFEIQVFMDAVGRVVYPINYQGSNYLPVRAASYLMGENIEWDAGQKLITISQKKDEAVSETEVKEDEEVKKLRDFLTDIVTVFDEATAKVVGLGNTPESAGLDSLVTSISDDVRKINRITDAIKNLETRGFSHEELGAYEKLHAYAESTGYYVLIAENIIYMAAEGQDYSMFAETFLTFAMDAQSKYEAARDALRSL